MSDHINEKDRTLALEHLRFTEARARAAVAKTLLTSLGNHSRHLTPEDRHDYAYAVWAEFRGDDDRATYMPLELQAGVFAQAALWLRQDVLIRLARETWGDVPMDAADGVNRVQWMPDDDALILTVGHLHSDGTAMTVDMVVTPMRVGGSVR